MISNIEASSLDVSPLSKMKTGKESNLFFFAGRQAIKLRSRHLIENTFLIVLETASEKCNELSCLRLPPCACQSKRHTQLQKKLAVAAAASI